ncbi:glycoside hydrolase family 6 protein [Nonomuraea sp. NPDC049419]|uniref:glycoside hydrolase family 6 protein n=1 Tax=Nonomuraea sp. NPDC049419 TaxID=3155772 RepID=UPI003443A47F
MTLESLRNGDPRQVGPYTLLGRLGEGGMGVVYLGEGPGGRVAVKVIHARMDADAGFRRRFAREVAAAQRVARFCTAPVLDADVSGDVAYLVTEYVEGPSLGAAVQESGPLKGSALDGLAAAMAMALRAIHGAGVVHRDLKPSNVLLSQVGPKVIDFGIAHLVDSEMSSAIVGTPSYMSPEQVSGVTVGPASDIFSWGCTVAYAASGVSPFGTGSVPDVLMRVINDPPELSGLPGPLHDLVVAALSKNPAERPTAQDLMDRLSTGPGSAALPELPGSSVPVAEPPQETGRWVREDEGALTAASGQRKWVLAAAVAVVAVAGFSVAMAVRGSGDPGADGRASATGASRTTGASVSATGGTGKSTGKSTPGSGGGRAGNPLRAGGAVAFYSPKEPFASEQADRWRKDRPKDAALMERLAAVPHAIRLADPEVRPKVAAAITASGRAGAVPVFMVDKLPGSDCRPPADGALKGYQEWIEGIARTIGPSKAVVILEPGSLVRIPGAKNCDPGGSPEPRYQALRAAVATLKSNPGTAVYLDGAQAHWPGTELMAERLIGAGVERADGFFLNTAAFTATEPTVAYGKELSACIGVRVKSGGSGCSKAAQADPAAMPHFVVDTSRNGQGTWVPDEHYKDPQTWCNPPGRGVGPRPTTETGEELVDAYLWISRPGVSGGRCRRGTDGEKDPERGVVSPPSGAWWDVLGLEMAKNANPPLR